MGSPFFTGHCTPCGERRQDPGFSMVGRLSIRRILWSRDPTLLLEDAVAGSRATSVDDLEWLAVHGNDETRVGVGENAHTPGSTRRRLMDDLDVVNYRIGLIAAMKLCDPEVNRAFWNRENRRKLQKTDAVYQPSIKNWQATPAPRKTSFVNLRPSPTR
jgi:hypothetical protein